MKWHGWILLLIAFVLGAMFPAPVNAARAKLGV